MAKKYIPKRPVFSVIRLHLICRDLIDQSTKDRTQALETYQFFKDRVLDNETDDASKALMVKSLEVAQKAKDAAIKAVELVLKVENSENFKQEGPATLAKNKVPSFRELADMGKE